MLFNFLYYVALWNVVLCFSVCMLATLIYDCYHQNLKLNMGGYLFRQEL